MCIRDRRDRAKREKEEAERAAAREITRIKQEAAHEADRAAQRAVSYTHLDVYKRQAYARPENRVDVNKPFRPSKITREAAREAYPEWYERVIVLSLIHI